MKKLLLSITAAGLVATSFARGNGGGINGFDAGNFLLYGVGSYSNSYGTGTQKFGGANSVTSDNPQYINWRIAPGIGYNITDNLTLGVDGSYGESKTNFDRRTITTFPATTKYHTFEYTMGPFIRYSYPLGEHFFAFGQFTAHYVRGRSTTYTSAQSVGGAVYSKDDNYKGVDGMLTPALGVKLTKSLGLTFAIGSVNYSYIKTNYSTQGYAAGTELTGKQFGFGATFGQEFTFGIQKYFGGMHRMHHHAEMMDDTRHMDTTDDSGNTDDMNGDKMPKRHRRHHKSDDE